MNRFPSLVLNFFAIVAPSTVVCWVHGMQSIYSHLASLTCQGTRICKGHAENVDRESCKRLNIRAVWKEDVHLCATELLVSRFQLFASNDQGQPYGGDVGSSYPEELHHRVSRGRDCLKSQCFLMSDQNGISQCFDLGCVSSDLVFNYKPL